MDAQGFAQRSVCRELFILMLIPRPQIVALMLGLFST